MVVAHYGCSGVLAALTSKRIGLTDNWLLHVHRVKMHHKEHLMHLCRHEQENVLCEMNVIEQIIRGANQRGTRRLGMRPKLAVHGWCYGLRDGLVKDLDVTMSNPEMVTDTYRAAVARYPRAEGSQSAD